MTWLDFEKSSHSPHYSKPFWSVLNHRSIRPHQSRDLPFRMIKSQNQPQYVPKRMTPDIHIGLSKRSSLRYLVFGLPQKVGQIPIRPPTLQRTCWRLTSQQMNWRFSQRWWWVWGCWWPTLRGFVLFFFWGGEFSQSMLGSKKARGEETSMIFFLVEKMICTVQTTNICYFFRMFNQEKNTRKCMTRNWGSKKRETFSITTSSWVERWWNGWMATCWARFIQVQVTHPHPVSKFIGFEWMEDEIWCHPRWFGSSPRGVMFHFRKSKSKGRLETIRLLLLWMK